MWCVQTNCSKKYTKDPGRGRIAGGAAKTLPPSLWVSQPHRPNLRRQLFFLAQTMFLGGIAGGLASCSRFEWGSGGDAWMFVC